MIFGSAFPELPFVLGRKLTCLVDSNISTFTFSPILIHRDTLLDNIALIGYNTLSLLDNISQS
jgi:hypothetical protein